MREKSLADPLPIGTNLAANKVHEGLKTAVVVEHCYMRVPITISRADPVSQPTGIPTHVSFPNDDLLAVAVRLLHP